MKGFTEVDDRNFSREVLDSKLPVLVEFGADWCVPCKRLEPLLEKFHDENPGRFRLAHINVDQATNVTVQYQVQSLPTLILFVEGRPRQTSFGLVSSDHLTENYAHLI
jgi:thioredoxin 1